MTPSQRLETKIWFTLTFSLITLYTIWPQFDLWFSSWFYKPDVGFIASEWPWVHAWHMSIPWVGRAMLITALLLLFLRHRLLTVQNQRKVISLLICMVLGLWLIMHEGFKDNWGRARPSEITEFGGPKTYSSPLVPSKACQQNCSFMSGHAGTGFVLISLGALATKRTRRRWLIIGWLVGATLGAIRIAQGGHFFGDVVFGGLMLWSCAIGTRWLYIRKRHAHIKSKAIHNIKQV